MRTSVRTIVQALLLLALSFASGLTVNAVRGKNRIDLARNYVPHVAPPAATGTAPAEPYGTVTLADVVASVAAEQRGGLDVIIDARNEDAYQRGHVDGALHCDPYRLDTCIDRTLEAAAGAERVIVYCHGGTCEDSYLLCGELVARGLGEDQLYVFKGGWEAWEGRARDAGAPRPAAADLPPAEDAESASSPARSDDEPAASEAPLQPPPAPGPNVAPAPVPAAAVGPQGFQELTLEEVVRLFEHGNTEAGLHLFVDARDDEAFSGGHIPGAIQCDFYRIDYYFPEVLARAPRAEKIVVYCGGGDCEDSLYVCGELLKADVPRAHILLFRGGWAEWRGREDLPIETGGEP